MLLMGRGRPREHPKGIPMGDDVISGEKAPLGRIVCHFRLRMRTLKENPSVSRDILSHPVAMVLVLLYYILHYY